MSARRTVVASLGLLWCAVAGAGCMDQVLASAGPDQTVDAGATVMLDGSASTPDRSGALNYAWTVSEGPEVAFSDVHGRRTSFTAPRQGTETRFIIRLDVTYVDYAGQPVPSNTDSDRLVVRVRADLALVGQDEPSNADQEAEGEDAASTNGADPQDEDDTSNDNADDDEANETTGDGGAQ